MYGFVHIVLRYCGEYCVSFNGCAHVFLRVSDLEFLDEKWSGCGRVIEGVMNVLLLLMILMFLFF